MSRSGYTDGYDDDQWSFIMWRGAVTSALRGRRGQRFLRELLAALDALPVKRLAANLLVVPDVITCSHWGLHEVESVCTLGAVGRQRGINMSNIDPEDYDTVSNIFGIATAMAREIVYENDEIYGARETPENRFTRVHAWATSKIRKSNGRVHYNAENYPL